MYKQCETFDKTLAACVLRPNDQVSIPFDPANTDYAEFKRLINADEAELQDADGNVMSAEAAKQFVATLP